VYAVCVASTAMQEDVASLRAHFGLMIHCVRASLESKGDIPLDPWDLNNWNGCLQLFSKLEQDIVVLEMGK
jgi:hypothetical protein